MLLPPCFVTCLLALAAFGTAVPAPRFPCPPAEALTAVPRLNSHAAPSAGRSAFCPYRGGQCQLLVFYVWHHQSPLWVTLRPPVNHTMPLAKNRRSYDLHWYSSEPFEVLKRKQKSPHALNTFGLPTKQPDDAANNTQKYRTQWHFEAMPSPIHRSLLIMNRNAAQSHSDLTFPIDCEGIFQTLRSPHRSFLTTKITNHSTRKC